MRREESRPSRERPSPKEYYYIKYPDKARGLKVIKCTTPTCFGCCLHGEHVPEACYYCQAPVRVPSAGAGSQSSKASAPRHGAPGDSPKNEQQADTLYQELLDHKMSEQDALAFVKKRHGDNFTPKQPGEVDHELTASRLTKVPTISVTSRSK